MSESGDLSESKPKPTEFIGLNDRVLDRLLTSVKDAMANDPEYIEKAKQWMREMDREADQLAIDLGLGPEDKYTVMAFLSEERSRPHRSKPGEVIPFKLKSKDSSSK